MKTKNKLNVRLLRKIQKHILEEPLRFLMNWFVMRKRGKAKTFRGDNGQQEFPPCGTAACIAGWANLLNGVVDASDIFSAVSLIGIPDDPRSIDALFGLSYWPDKFRESYSLASSPAVRAKIAAKRIDHFIKYRE